MIVDSSALVAIVRAESDAAAYAAALVSADTAMSAVNYVEAAVVVDSARPTCQDGTRHTMSVN